ncbi:MAG: isochorismatase family cysteine hydrolase [Cellulosilyticaceae bacterium]
MARVSEHFLEHYDPILKQAIHKPILFVVDMIEGFVNVGALHDQAIQSVTPSILKVLEEEDARVIFVADSHPPKTREFNSYPSHCVIGTKESEILPELKKYAYEVMHKNSTNTFTSPDFQTFLTQRIDAYEDIIIMGCCSDICILQFALCLNAWLNEHNETSKRIIIPIDCIETFHIEGVHDAMEHNEYSIKNMESNGITIVTHIQKG